MTTRYAALINSMMTMLHHDDEEQLDKAINELTFSELRELAKRLACASYADLMLLAELCQDDLTVWLQDIGRGIALAEAVR